MSFAAAGALAEPGFPASAASADNTLAAAPSAGTAGGAEVISGASCGVQLLKHQHACHTVQVLLTGTTAAPAASECKPARPPDLVESRHCKLRAVL